jgi:hypothetical protein
MEAEGSSPCSQVPATGPYTDQPYFPKIRFNIILPPTPKSSEFFFQASQPKYRALSSPSCVLRIPPIFILHDTILIFDELLVTHFY